MQRGIINIFHHSISVETILKVSSIDAHVRDFQHRFCVLFHEVNLVSVLAVNVLHFVTQVVLARIEMVRVRGRWNVSRALSMRVRWQNLRERVPHL